MPSVTSLPPLRWWAAVASGDARRRHRVYAVAAIVGVSALIALGACNDILAARHAAGGLSYDVGSLADVGFHRPSLAVARDAAKAWYDQTTVGLDLTGPSWLVGLYLLFDFVFIAAYSTFLAVVLWHGYLRLSPDLGRPVAAAQRKIAGWAFAMVLGLAVADVVENVATAQLFSALTGHNVLFPSLLGARAMFVLLFAAAAVKWVLTLLVLGGVVVVGIGLLSQQLASPPGGTDNDNMAKRRTAFGQTMTTLATLRIQALLVVFFAFFLLGPVAQPQAADVMRRWAFSGDAPDGIWAIVLTTWFCVVTYTVAGRLLSSAPVGPRKPIPTRPIWVVGAVLTVAGAIGLWLAHRLEGLLAIGLIVLAVAILSAVLGSIDELGSAVLQPPGAGTDVLPPLLTVLPLVVLGVAVLKAGTTEVVYSHTWRFLILVVVGIALQAVGWWGYALVAGRWKRRLTDVTPESSPVEPIVLLVSVFLVVGFTLWVWLDPWGAGGRAGVLGALAVFSVLVSLLGFAALRVEQVFTPPSCFRVLGLKRIPVFVLAILAIVGASRFDAGGYHDVRTLPLPAGQQHPQLTYVAAWNRWRDAQGLVPGGSGPKRVVPLVLVAAEGGGIRAAFWTSRVLDCVYDAKPADCGGAAANPNASTAPPAFAESGVSGGSLGLIEFLAHGRSNVDDKDPDWVTRRLGGDQLAAMWAWTLFADIPNALIRADVGQDRAGILEQTWERPWEPSAGTTKNAMQDGFLTSSAADDGTPILLMNGTSVQDGCRFNTSLISGDIDSLEAAGEDRLRDCLTLRAYEAATKLPEEKRANWVFGATQDIGELLCPGSDVRLSTAALLSARFPLVTPAARVQHCGNSHLATFVVDGGYFDTSAASPVVELWAKLEPLVDSFNRANADQCVVPMMLQIDNHYKEPRGIAATARTPELTVPLEAVKAARDARENDARHTAALAFDGRFGPYSAVTLDGKPVDRYAHVYPRSHPGTTAPLGWALSDQSMQDLTVQLGGLNKAELRKVSSWFDPRLQCKPVTAK